MDFRSWIMALALGCGASLAAQAAGPAPRPAMPALPAPATAAVAPEVYAQFAGQSFSQGPRSKPIVALTFDDGPSPATTPRVVEILKEHNATATFFMLGTMIKQNPETAQLVADAGFELGHHSETHAQLTKLSADGQRAEINGARDRVEALTGRPAPLFRPPYGAINTRLRELCKSEGLVLCLWAVDPRDWEPSATPQRDIDKVLAGASNGSVILLHDIKPKTVEALPGIIKGLREKGFELVTVSQLLEAKMNEPDPQPAASGGGANPEPPSAPLVLSLDETN